MLKFIKEFNEKYEDGVFAMVALFVVMFVSAMLIF